MNIFKHFTMSWWQVSIFKLGLICGGIILGAYFPAFFLNWMPLVIVLFVISCVYLIPVWWRQVR
ncbi:MAG TPA: hypothetical protein VMJ72_00170 [Candidatus Paceibacterota bacterium]|nr:hypothetical protein [Candidatus Paceibacterota bacterium]